MKKKILVTAKITPDLDGVASAIAYAQYLNKVKKDAFYEAAFKGDKQIEVGFVFDKIIKCKFPQIKPDCIYNSFILVDFSANKGLPEIVDPLKVTELIDHREWGVEYKSFPNAKFQIEIVGSCATLIAEKLFSNKIKIDDKSALLLYLAIFSNTLNLKANVTTIRDKKIVKKLERSCCDCQEHLVKKMFHFKTNNIIRRLDFALISDSKLIDIKKETLGIYQLEVYGIEKLIPDKIIKIIKVMLSTKNIHWGYCTIADIKEGKTYLILTDNSKVDVFTNILDFKRKGNYLYSDKLYLRKEIISKLS